MELGSPQYLLLLDLDGVSALERRSPVDNSLEILRLHDDMAELLARFECKVVVLTHRSRKEALKILHAIGLRDWSADDVFAAEQLLWARGRSPWRILRDGLVKSAALPDIEARFGVSRQRMAIIDDREVNLTDLVGAGVGLGLMAPSQIHEDGAVITSFDLSEAIQIFTAWRAGGDAGRIHSLTPRTIGAPSARQTGMNTRQDGAHLFNWTRYLARHGRNFVRGLVRPGRVAGR
jgi:hypothetical protein